MPTDDRYSQSPYAASALNLSSAHAISKGEGTTVAVVDTGAQLGHPALKTNFNGVARYDFVDDDNNPSEPEFAPDEDSRNNEMVGHGTHVAGIVDLVAPKAKIMPLRVLDREGYGTSFHIAEAISFADSNGADVINLSLGMPDPTLLGLAPPKLLREKVEEAIRDGAVVVAAAGNYNNFVPTYPAARGSTADDDDGLLAVTSVNWEERKSDFANYGMWVDIAAPGENILSTYPVSTYAYWSGTSMAAPFLSGQATLIHSVEGSLDPAGIEVKIRCSARTISQDPTRTMLGAGHTDVGASLEQAPGSHCTFTLGTNRKSLARRGSVPSPPRGKALGSASPQVARRHGALEHTPGTQQALLRQGHLYRRASRPVSVIVLHLTHDRLSPGTLGITPSERSTQSHRSSLVTSR